MSDDPAARLRALAEPYREQAQRFPYVASVRIADLLALLDDTATLRAQLVQAEQAKDDFTVGVHEMLGELLAAHQITPEPCPGGPCVANALLAVGQALTTERTARARYEAALTTIRERFRGEVCDTYEVCTHRACAASYGAWATADAALTAPPGAGESDDGC